MVRLKDRKGKKAEQSKEEMRKLRHRFAQKKYKMKLKQAQLDLEKRAETATKQLLAAKDSIKKKDNLIKEMTAIIAVQSEEIQQLKALQLLGHFPVPFPQKASNCSSTAQTVLADRREEFTHLSTTPRSSHSTGFPHTVNAHPLKRERCTDEFEVSENEDFDGMARQKCRKLNDRVTPYAWKDISNYKNVSKDKQDKTEECTDFTEIPNQLQKFFSIDLYELNAN